ncbi:MAG TPA: adenylate/guanylate cyclase domain-containing protein [Pseudolabrys sp.]|nr:adenylate/guanylate cyclase domain-containing protein [Pseudolabrys sp.]
MSSQERPPSASRAVKAERRNLTVVFCDMVGSTELSSRLDPEDMRDIMRAFQRSCETAIFGFDGRIGRYMGDGILAYFGFPAAHEDSAERAVQAALEGIRLVSELSFEGVPKIEMRVGIATGLVVVGDLIGEGSSREFALVGDAPNLAARLQQLAKPNQILVAPATRRLLGDLFEFEDLGDLEVKGFLEPIAISGVVRRSKASRFEARRTGRIAPLIGREAELAVLRDAFEKAKTGHGQLVAVCGEPGIGKSRLVNSFRHQMPPGSCRVFSFQCSSYHLSSPWYPVIRHVDDVLGSGYEARGSNKLERLEALIDDISPTRRASIVPLLAPLLGISTEGRYPPLELTPQQQKQRTFLAMVEMLRAHCEQQPVILIAEDLHWIDHTSSQMLELIRENLPNWRMLLIATFRPEYRSLGGADAWINLNRLSPTQVASMVEAIDSSRKLPTAVIGEIISKTDGVPLFVEEVTMTVLASGASEKGVSGGASWSTAVPDTLQDSLMARLDNLASAKTVAQIASAIGREFSFDLLEAIAPSPPQDVRAAVDRLREAGLLSRREFSAIETYAFKHALVQETAYASMLRSERQPLHLRIAETLSTKFVDVAEGAPEVVAYHYTQAREITPAIHHWLKAGRQASKRSAFMEAVTHFETALKLLEELPQDKTRLELELQLQQSLANASIAAKGFGAPQTIVAFNRALDLCKELGSGPQMFAVLNGLVGAHLMGAEIPKARALAQDLLALAMEHNDQTALLMGHRVLGMSLFMLGELAQATRELKKAIALYNPEQHAPLALIFSHDFKATAQVYLGVVTALCGDIDEGVGHSLDALGYAEELRHPHSICYVLSFVAGTYLCAGNPQAAFPVADRTVAQSNEQGFPQWVAGGLMLRGWARLELGELEAGLADIRSSIRALERTGTRIWMQFSHYLLARALAADHQWAKAAEIVDRLMTEIKAAGGRWYEAEVMRLRGDILRGQHGPVSEIEACYEAAIATARRQGARLWELRAMESLAMLREAGTGRTAGAKQKPSVKI